MWKHVWWSKVKKSGCRPKRSGFLIDCTHTACLLFLKGNNIFKTWNLSSIHHPSFQQLPISSMLITKCLWYPFGQWSFFVVYIFFSCNEIVSTTSLVREIKACPYKRQWETLAWSPSPSPPHHHHHITTNIIITITIITTIIIDHHHHYHHHIRANWTSWTLLAVKDRARRRRLEIVWKRSVFLFNVGIIIITRVFIIIIQLLLWQYHRLSPA